MKNIVLSLLSVSVLFFASSAIAQAGPFDACTLKNTPSKVSQGRFIWKPLGNHFNRAVIVIPRAYYTGKLSGRAIVELYNEAGVRFEVTKLKTTGLCKGNPECLFAQVNIAAKSGAFYEKKYGKVFVRIRPAKGSTSNAGCRYYGVNRPKQRAEFVG
jgi:hypothetical protein